MDAAVNEPAAGDTQASRQRKRIRGGIPRPVRGWLAIAGILIGGILCGWGARLAFWFVAHDWIGVQLSDWFPWWLSANIIFAHLAASAFVLAAARYWFRRRPSDTDPGD